MAGGKSLSIFELVAAAFDDAAQGIDRGVDRPLDQPFPPGRDESNSAVVFQIFANEVSIIAFVGEQHLGCWPIGLHDRQVVFIIGDFAPGYGKCYG